VVERILGKAEVVSSILTGSTISALTVNVDPELGKLGYFKSLRIDASLLRMAESGLKAQSVCCGSCVSRGNAEGHRRGAIELLFQRLFQQSPMNGL
jgi:hypothetical protein